MNEKQLAALMDLHRKTTQKKWIARLEHEAATDNKWTEIEDTQGEFLGSFEHNADGIFAAAAHNDLPVLADMLRRAVEALEAQRTMVNSGQQPRKFDEALDWRLNDLRVRDLVDALLDEWNGEG